MDWQLRIALIIAGCALVAYVYYDYSKKKRIQKENERLKKQFSSISETVDSAGFDHVGVGTPRPAAGDENKAESKKVSSESGVSAKEVEGTTVEKFIEKSLERDDVADNFQTQSNTSSNEELVDKDNPRNLQPSADAGINDDKNESNETPEKAMVLSLLLQAPQGNHFKGRDFLPLFLSQGLRHGEMGIFHRRARAGKDPGPVLFSLANGIAPGTFDINNMENFETPALACFVTLPGPDDAQVAYNAMYKTCLLLQQELGGELLDETKSIYSKQTHNHRLDQIKDYSFKFGS